MRFLILFFILVQGRISIAQVVLAKKANVEIFSKSIIEDIKAETNDATAAMNFKTGKMFFKVPMRKMKFENALMQDHFNENYIESHKFPTGEFSGTIDEIPDMNKNGEYKIVVKGKLTVHGVTKDRELNATIKIENGKINGKSTFKVKCEDHGVEIPKLLIRHIAEEIEVSVSADFLPLSQ